MHKRYLLVPALLVAGTAQANTNLTLPETVVTAARIEQPRDAAMAANTVFTRADIERLQARSVPELISRVPGVQQHNNGGIPAYFLRGSNTAQSLILVDGQRIASASSGIARIDYLNIDNIERIEVIRGPRSSVYGADAIGGVIQIFTRQGQAGLQPRVRLGVGSNHTYERSASLAGGDQQTRFVLGASLDETRGFDRTSDDVGNDRDRDGQRNEAVFLRLDHELLDNWQAGLSLNQQRGTNEYDDAYEFVPGSPEDAFRVRSYSAYLNGQLTDTWSSRIEIGHAQDRNEATGSAWNDGYIHTFRHSAAWLNNLQLTPNQRLMVGGDWQRDRLASSNDFARTRRENLAGFVQHSWSQPGFSTELGARRDDNQHFGSHDTFNAALAIPSGDTQQWMLSYATGFRAPTFNDLYAPPGWGGNPDLDPERSRTWELQWRGDLEALRLEASLYRTDIRDLIAWNSTTFQVENVNEARINGFEGAATRDLFGWTARAGLSIIDPRDRDTGRTLQLRARRTLSLDLDRQLGEFSVGATWQLTSQRYANPANSETLAGYGTLDVRGSWQASQAIRLDLKVTNLLDRDYHLGTYQRPTGVSWTAPSVTYPYQEEGRAALLAITWTPQY